MKNLTSRRSDGLTRRVRNLTRAGRPNPIAHPLRGRVGEVGTAVGPVTERHQRATARGRCSV